MNSEWATMLESTKRQEDIFRMCVGVFMVAAILFGILELAGVVHI